MRVFPEKYEELEIDKYNKQLMATIKKLYRDDELTTFMLSCNPSKTKDGIVDILITESGVLCIKMLSEITQDQLLPKLFERQAQQKQEMQIIIDRMKLQKNLLSGGLVKYSVRIISVFPLCKHPDLPENAAMAEFNAFVDRDCYFCDFLSKEMREKSFIERMLAYSNKFKITESVLIDDATNLIVADSIEAKSPINVDDSSSQVHKASDEEEALEAIKEKARTNTAQKFSDELSRYVEKNDKYKREYEAFRKLMLVENITTLKVQMH